MSGPYERPSRSMPRAATVATALLFAVVPVAVPAFLLRDTGAPVGGAAGTGPPSGTGPASPSASSASSSAPSSSAPALPSPEPEPAPLPSAGATLPSTAPSTGAPTTRPPAITPARRPGIDLEITGLRWVPSAPRPGDRVVFTATVRNAGSAPTPAGTIVGVLYSVDGARVSWSSADATPLAPGESRDYPADSPGGDVWFALPGSHALVAYVDDVNRLQESTEGNNVRTATVNVR